jgi:hypothetical protein
MPRMHFQRLLEEAHRLVDVAALLRLDGAYQNLLQIVHLPLPEALAPFRRLAEVVFGKPGMAIDSSSSPARICAPDQMHAIFLPAEHSEALRPASAAKGGFTGLLSP